MNLYVCLYVLVYVLIVNNYLKYIKKTYHYGKIHV